MMKKRLTFSQILHKDKLMMVVSLILAIVIWSLVVYDQGNTEERSISGIPVSVSLTPFASEELNLRIVDGADAVATVYVEGSRSVIGRLSRQDIVITADTGLVLTAGKHTVPIRAASSGKGKYDIVNVVGDDGANATITITCDVIYEKAFPLSSDNVQMPNLTLSDSQQLRFGSPSPSGTAIKEGNVTVSGPKTRVNQIARVAAIVREEAQLEKTASFTADLVAYDADNRPVEGVSFLGAENSQVNVVVPVLHYYKEELTVTVHNAPEGLAEKVTVQPQTVELWAIPSEVDEYLAEVRNHLTIDFHQILAEGTDIALPLELRKTSSFIPFANSEKIQLDMDLSAYTNKHFSVSLSDVDLEVSNVPEGCKLEWQESEPLKITLCGRSAALKKIKADQLKFVVDFKDLSVGYQTVKVFVQCEDATVWTYYGEDGYEAQVHIVSE